ncbi:MAG: HAD family hydrolase [Acidobacteria bacterium]|nr:MAG: HAD family hydrolase [Acidobacteriota bacterium]
MDMFCGNNDFEQRRVYLSKLKILLWDIDGTLILSTVRGGYKQYFEPTMKRIFGSVGDLHKVIPSGMTDTQIMYESLKSLNITPEAILERKNELLEVFREEMLRALGNSEDSYRVLPGVREILEQTSTKRGVFINALLTGNLSVAAEIKLTSVGLWRYFADAPNIFGEISCDRSALAFQSASLFREKYNFDFLPQQFVIIGDTPNDIKTARTFGAKVLAVATGRIHGFDELLECGPDAILEDLSNTEEVLRILENL